MANSEAIYAIWCVPVLLLSFWLNARQQYHFTVINALLACGLALAINIIIGWLWQHPRPFVIPTGHNFLSHKPDPSFPSDHMTIIMTMAISCMLRHSTRWIGVGLSLLGLGIGWARIYLGVHFPLDMLGAIGVAIVSALVLYFLSPFFIHRLYTVLRRCYRRLCAPLIKRGWLFD